VKVWRATRRVDIGGLLTPVSGVGRRNLQTHGENDDATDLSAFGLQEFETLSKGNATASASPSRKNRNFQK